MKKVRVLYLTAILIVLCVCSIFLISFYIDKNKDGEAMFEYNGHGGTFKNTISEMDTPDPSMVYRDGFYYLTFTHNGTDIMVMKSRTIDFKQAERKVVWYPPVNTMYSAEIWAPELQYLKGKWYIYFAADDGRNENHRMYALEAVSDDPMGDYEFKGQIDDGSNKWAIDGLVMEHQGQLYFVWSGWEGDVNISQNTYIAPMSDPLTISGPRVKLSEPDLEWERAGGPPYIQEGQAILKHHDQLFIAYSGAGSWTPFYSIGLLHLQENGDPLNPSHWTKLEQPILTMDEEADVYGPGHNSFVQSPDGKETWIVYHATTNKNDGWNNRKGRAQKVEWNEDGIPVIGKPLSLLAAIPAPSSEGLYLAQYAQAAEHSVQFKHITVSQNGDYPLLVHYDNSLAEVQLKIFVNDVEIEQVRLSPTIDNRRGYYWMHVPLQEGSNTIGLTTEDGLSIYAIELPRYEAEDAVESDGASIEKNPFASGRGIAIGNDLATGKLTFDQIIVPQQGDYKLAIGISNRSSEQETIELLVNDKDSIKFDVEPGDRAIFGKVVVQASLKEGVNMVQLVNLPNVIAIDYIDVIK